MKDASNTYIEVNTATLYYYADRLIAVNNRIIQLDERVNNLYKKVGLRDLFNVIKNNSLKSGTYKIRNCSKYLDETASDFENVEHDVASLF